MDRARVSYARKRRERSLLGPHWLIAAAAAAGLATAAAVCVRGTSPPVVAPAASRNNLEPQPTDPPSAIERTAAAESAPALLPLEPALPLRPGMTGPTLRPIQLAAAEEVPPPSAEPPRVEQFPAAKPVLRLPKLKQPDEKPVAPPPVVPRGNPMKVPVVGSSKADQLEITQSGGKVSITSRGVPLNQLLMLLAQNQGLNIVCADSLNTPVTVTLDKVPLENALNSILAIAGCSWVREGEVIFVTSMAANARLPAAVQGRLLRVFPLDFASAADVEKAIKPMLSPVGQCSISASKSTDNRQTQEVVVVEDIPSYLQVIEQYIEQIDRAPRQVLIEAHVFSVELKTEDRIGVDLAGIFQTVTRDTSIRTQGFATATGQGFVFDFQASDMTALVDALRRQTNAKTLASPKVLVLNGQEARMQLGKQIGYKVATTTETSTMESVNFLDTGVVLTVTPRITREGHVLMKVKPEVSDGRINPDTKAPDKDTTEVETAVMLADGRGMVIGGLIKQDDTQTQSKVPFLGDLWLVGRLFQHREGARGRHEIIITLVPRVVPCCMAEGDRHAQEVERSTTPIVDQNLQPVPRPDNAVLPDTFDNPARMRDLPIFQHHRKKKGEPPVALTLPDTTSPYYGGEQGQTPPPPPPVFQGPVLAPQYEDVQKGP